jgi:hypothetical protein
MPDDKNDWLRTLMMGLGALVAVSLVLGVVFSAFALGLVNVAGLGSSGGQSAQPSLFIPSPSPTPSESASPSPSPTPSPSPSAAPSTTAAEEKKKPKKKRRPKITLAASPETVGTYERINLTGRYPGAEGTTLQVQRFQGSWVDFPTTATVSDSSFATWIETGRSGTNRFRMLDTSTGRTSKPVVVTVG